MKLLNFTIIKLCLCLVIGILIASFVTIPLETILYVSIGLLILLSCSLIISKRQAEKNLSFGILALLTMLSIGMLVVNLHDQRQFKNHYFNIISTKSDSSKIISFKVSEVLKPTAYHDKYIVNVLKVDNVFTSGKLLLNVMKDSLSNPLQVDDVLMASASFLPLNPPLNPYQFDYKNYLKKRYIDHQIFAETKALFEVNSEANTIYGYAAQIRNKIDQKLKNYHFKADELAIIDALLLGQRKDISQDTYNNYVNAGAIHILAVSGLHVGIILLLLNTALRPLERIKHGKTLKIIFILILLWSFAIVAGLSPSVTRAVTMFTIIGIGMNLNRPTNIYNTLAISLFFLLLFKPMFLFDVGFQMSYLAVLAIVSIQPMLASTWTPKWKLVNYFWELMCVTAAAQIGVVPISLYYFHQFPGLFFVSNLVIIPFLGFILGFGIIVIGMALLNILPQWMANIFGFCISAMNDFVSWISHQESFVFRNISFGIVFVIVSYVMIISLFSYFKKPNYSRLVLVLTAIILIQVGLIFENYKTHSNEFVVFHKSKFSLIGMKDNEQLTLATNFDSLSQSRDHIIRNYKIGNSVVTIDKSQLQSVYSINNEQLLVIDSMGIYNVKTFQPNYVLLRNSPKINLKRLIDSIDPKLIIADGSNYKSYVRRWNATCTEQKVPFHSTYEKGAFVFKY